MGAKWPGCKGRDEGTYGACGVDGTCAGAPYGLKKGLAWENGGVYIETDGAPWDVCVWNMVCECDETNWLDMGGVDGEAMS